MRVNVKVSVHSQDVTIDLSSYAMGLYEQWMETGEDEIFQDLADYIGDSVSDVLEFDIEDVKPSG